MMFCALPLLLGLQTPLINDVATAKIYAERILEIMNYKVPSEEPEIRDGFVSKRQPAWIIKWGPFELSQQKDGVVSHFQRKGAKYELIENLGKAHDAKLGQEYFTKIAHQLSVPEAARPEFMGWRGPRPYSPDTSTDVTIMPIWKAPNGQKYSLGMLTANPKDRSITLFFPGICSDYPDIFTPVKLKEKGR